MLPVSIDVIANNVLRYSRFSLGEQDYHNPRCSSPDYVRLHAEAYSEWLAGVLYTVAVERRGREQHFQTRMGQFGKALSKQRARLRLARRVGQGRSYLPNQAYIFLAEVDLDPHKTFMPRRERWLANEDFALPVMLGSFPEMLPEISAKARGGLGDDADYRVAVTVR